MHVNRREGHLSRCMTQPFYQRMDSSPLTPGAQNRVSQHHPKGDSHAAVACKPRRVGACFARPIHKFAPGNVTTWRKCNNSQNRWIQSIKCSATTPTISREHRDPRDSLWSDTWNEQLSNERFKCFNFNTTRAAFLPKQNFMLSDFERPNPGQVREERARNRCGRGRIQSRGDERARARARMERELDRVARGGRPGAGRREGRF